MEIVLFLIFWGVMGSVYVDVKQSGPESKVSKGGERWGGDDACQIYARCDPSPSGARLCRRRASQSSESSDGEISRGFSE
jgi:hypothetical protein